MEKDKYDKEGNYLADNRGNVLYDLIHSLGDETDHDFRITIDPENNCNSFIIEIYDGGEPLVWVKSPKNPNEGATLLDTTVRLAGEELISHFEKEAKELSNKTNSINEKISVLKEKFKV